jgi:hypothetical protein
MKRYKNTRIIVFKDGTFYNINHLRWINGYNINGYIMVSVSVNNGCKEREYAHRMVAMLYVPNPNNYKSVNHKDGNKKNNHVSNLEWVTYKENTAHAIESGLFKIKQKKNRISYDDRKRCLELRLSGLEYKEISAILGYNVSVIGDYLRGDTHKNEPRGLMRLL